MPLRELSVQLCRAVPLALWLLVALTWIAAAQPAKLPRIGFLTARCEAAPGPNVAAFRQGLRDLGLRPGENVVIDYRWACYQLDRLPGQARELVALRVDVIVALEPPAARAARAVTLKIPIIIRSASPVEEGFVRSLAHPGGNITGLSSTADDLSGKRIELLKEMVPGLTRVAVLANPENQSNVVRLPALVADARAIGVQIEIKEVRTLAEMKRAITAATREGFGALLPLRDPLLVSHRRALAEAAIAAGLPAIHDDQEFVEVGGLASYGANLTDLYRRAASYVDKILKGAKPSELPVEQPTKFAFVINLKTARAIGLKIPESVLNLADEVLE